MDGGGKGPEKEAASITESRSSWGSLSNTSGLSKTVLIGSLLVGDADGLSASFFSAFGVLRFFRPCFLIVLFEGAIHVLADAFQVLVLGVFGVSGRIEWSLAIAGTAEDVEQSAPEGSGISPVVLWGSFRHLFFSPLQRVPCSFVVAIASELDRFLRNNPHFIQHRFQSKGIFAEEKRKFLRCRHFSS